MQQGRALRANLFSTLNGDITINEGNMKFL